LAQCPSYTTMLAKIATGFCREYSLYYISSLNHVPRGVSSIYEFISLGKKRFVLLMLQAKGEKRHSLEKWRHLCTVAPSSSSSSLMERSHSELTKQDSQKQLTPPQKEQQAEEKERILANALKYVNKMGWSVESLAIAAQELGLPAISHGLVENGPIELVYYFVDECNKKMIAEVKNRQEVFGQMLLRDKLKEIIKLRLEYIIPYINRWSEALALMAHPLYISSSLVRMASLADEICYQIGDASTNIDWYAKRTLVAGVYTATELYMLNDQSKDFCDTWAFLERRIDDMISLSKVKFAFDEAMATIANGALATVEGFFKSTRK
jgi:ubiquinone biosynthesis protein COQ9